jgi:hypothetical protein
MFYRTAPFGCPLLFPARKPESHFCRRYFYIWGNLPHQCYPHTSRQSGSPLERWSAFAKLRSTKNFAKIIHMFIVSRLLVYIPADLLIYGYFILSHTRLVQLGCLLHFFLSLTTGNFAISDSDGSTLLLVDSASKRGYLRPGSFRSGFTTAVDMLPRKGQDHFDERPGICYGI